MQRPCNGNVTHVTHLTHVTHVAISGRRVYSASWYLFQVTGLRIALPDDRTRFPEDEGGSSSRARACAPHNLSDDHVSAIHNGNKRNSRFLALVQFGRCASVSVL